MAWLRTEATFITILVLLAVWGAWFIWRTSFIVAGRRVFCLFDDAMISMTYARNLAAGHGLLYNRAAPPVEGFTHPLWTFSMVLIHLLRAARRHVSALVQVTSLALLLLNLIAVRRLARRFFSTGGGWMMAVLLTASYYPLNLWALQGMETALQSLLMILSIHETLAASESERPNYVRFAIPLSLALLLRLDLIFMVVGCIATLLIARGRRLFRDPRLLVGLAIIVIPNAAYFVFRLVYYHAFLPNTFYLKMTGMPRGVRVLRGLMMFLGFARPRLWLLVGIFAGTWIAARTRAFALSVTLIGVYFAYSIWVGGDAWENYNVGANRFIAPIMPLAFVVASGLLDRALAWMSTLTPRVDDVAKALATGLATLSIFLSVNGLSPGDSAADEHWNNLAISKTPLFVAMQKETVTAVSNLSGPISSGATVGSSMAGAFGYFSDWNVVDLLGYNEREIARESLAHPLTLDEWEKYLPGHLKWDYPYVLKQYRPDFFWQRPYYMTDAEVVDVLSPAGYQGFSGGWARNDSSKIRR